MKKEETVLKAGVYLAVNNINKQEYIVALAGKAPLLVVTNLLSIEDFLGKTVDALGYSNIRENMIMNPDEYTFSPINSSVLPTPISEIKAEESTEKLYTEKQWQNWLKILRETENIQDVIAKIMADTKYPYEIAQSIATEVNIRLCEEKGM